MDRLRGMDEKDRGVLMSWLDDGEFPQLGAGFKVVRKKKAQKVTKWKKAETQDANVAKPLIGFLGGSECQSPGLNKIEVSGQVNGAVQEWEQVISIVDSGAVDSVAPSSVAAHQPVTPSKGSMEGQTYSTADGTRLANLGQKTIMGLTDEDEALSMTFQMVDEVTRPLSSVGRIADQDNLVVLGRKGGYIYNVATGETTNFQRDQGVYVIKLWVPKTVAKEDFGRQG